MSSLTVKLGILAAGLMLSGCMQATTYEATNQTNFKPRDKELLAKVRYVNTPVAEPFRRAIVDYHRKEAPGSIVVDSDNHYLYSGGKDTLFRIHGTNQPEYIGASISSGCIRMTNEDVIDLYNRVKMGTIVVVLEPKHGDSPFNSQMALQGGGRGPMIQ